MQKCYLALGCFWKPEETFRTIKGIVETEVGYAGGKNEKVTYEEVCTGKTVSCLQIDMNICIVLSLLSGSGQVPLRSSQGQSCRECL